MYLIAGTRVVYILLSHRNENSEFQTCASAVLVCYVLTRSSTSSCVVRECAGELIAHLCSGFL